MRFTLTLDLAPDAYKPHIRTGIMNVLSRVRLEIIEHWERTEGTILDPNGNTVGHWAIEDTPSCDCETK